MVTLPDCVSLSVGISLLTLAQGLFHSNDTASLAW